VALVGIKINFSGLVRDGAACAGINSKHSKGRVEQSLAHMIMASFTFSSTAGATKDSQRKCQRISLQYPYLWRGEGETNLIFSKLCVWGGGGYGDDLDDSVLHLLHHGRGDGRITTKAAPPGIPHGWGHPIRSLHPLRELLPLFRDDDDL